MSRPVVAVVPVWNGEQHVRNLLDDLSATSLLHNIPVVFVDNGSDEETHGLVADAWADNDNWHLLWNTSNLGFTKAINQAIVHASKLVPDCDIILLNTDIRLTDPEWVAKLQAVAEAHPQAGIVIPRLRDLDGGLNTTHAYVDRGHRGFPLPLLPRDRGQYATTTAIESGTFAVAYITRACLDACGLLEELCETYASDSLYCILARAVGLEVWRCGDLTLTHAVGGSLANAEFNYSGQVARDTAYFRAVCPTPRAFCGKVNLAGVLGRNTGYGKLAWNMARALRAAEVEVAGLPLVPIDEPEVIDLPLFRDVVATPPDPAAPTLTITTPDHHPYHGTGEQIAVTMLECDGVPRSLIDPLNAQFDRLWTFSGFNLETFAKSGCTLPATLIPPPVDTDLYHPGLTPYVLPQARAINLVAVFEWGERKFTQWIRAALQALAGRDDICIHLRTFHGNHTLEAELTALCAVPGVRPAVRWLTEPVPEEEMGCLYRAADLVVCLGAEGIGMPLLEATACGVPALGYNWGAGAEYLDIADCLRVEPLGMVDAVAQCPYYKGFQWAVPSWWSFQRNLLWAVSHLDELRANAAVASKAVAETFALERVGAYYRGLLFEGLGVGG